MSAGDIDDTNVMGSLYVHPPINFLKCTNNLYIPKKTMMIFHYVSISEGSNGLGLDVVPLNELGVPVADEICRNSDLRECVDPNPLGHDDVGVCILNSLLSFEVPVTWKFSLRQGPFVRFSMTI